MEREETTRQLSFISAILPLPVDRMARIDWPEQSRCFFYTLMAPWNFAAIDSIKLLARESFVRPATVSGRRFPIDSL